MAAAAPAEFAHIAAHLHARRDAILARWRLAVDNDPKVSAVASLARTQFIDHVPRILDAFEHALRARDAGDERVAQTEQRAGAADHGESRWLYGYDSRETMREWGHLHICMAEELESCAVQRPDSVSLTVSTARLMLTKFFVDCMVESAASHAALDRTAAESRLEELEGASSQLRALHGERTELWREAAHDLRGTVGAVKLATAALGHVAASTGQAVAPQLPEFVGRVRRAVESLEALLSELIELTRLEAGREHREIARFDAAAALVELCDSLQPLASERRLFLRCEAPPELRVEGDAIKLRRIAQNLILNALKYTESGGVLVSCARQPGDVERWSLCVQDTGVGLDRASGTPLAQVIRAATREANSVLPDTDSHSAKAPTLSSQSTDTRPSGEGIGLSIVKRLCELLDASIELETQRGRGTTFRLVFPSRYS